MSLRIAEVLLDPSIPALKRFALMSATLGSTLLNTENEVNDFFVNIGRDKAHTSQTQDRAKNIDAVVLCIALAEELEVTARCSLFKMVAWEREGERERERERSVEHLQDRFQGFSN